jgi:hypothetical protein
VSAVNAHEQLRALLQRYGRAADARDVTVLAELFHPEAEISGAGGTLDRTQWLETMARPRAFPTSMHMLGDPLIDVDETAGTATLDTYAVVYQLSDPTTADADLTLGIRYLDDAVVHEGQWVVRRRRSQTLWMR